MLIIYLRAKHALRMSYNGFIVIATVLLNDGNNIVVWVANGVILLVDFEIDLLVDIVISEVCTRCRFCR